MQNSTELKPLEISRVIVVGIGQWLYEYVTLDDAVACIQGLEESVQEAGARLDFIEVRIEFASGESERCAYQDKRRVYAWMDRFR